MESSKTPEELAKEMAESVVDEPKIIKTTEFLRYHFTEGEKQDLATVMALNVIAARDDKEQAKAIASQYASRINEAVAKSNSAAQKIESGFEMRTIDCEEHYIYPDMIVRTIRIDNGKVVRERTMTNAELQEDMFKEEKER